ncbi:6377_t:CDS:10 [Ambispora gerdemannii]|uniref:6377_t:CDS:1 n=1 Tax=Ambispora gerdemannii TaxID=144530 RepID=A0A9N8UYM6_9GLOM|nr:6377_t:CDS:10 [Ambispora gerdemannii]
MTKDFIYIAEAERPTAIATIEALVNTGPAHSNRRLHITAAVTSKATAETCAKLGSLGCNVVRFDETVPARISLGEVHKMMIVLSPERLDAGVAYIEAAKRANVPFVLLESVLLADERQDHVGKQFAEAEKRLQALFGKKECEPQHEKHQEPGNIKARDNISPEECIDELRKHHHHSHWSVLRIGIYDHYLLAFKDCIRKGILDLPVGNGKFAPVAVEDVGKAAAHILDKSENYSERIYNITGPELLSGEALTKGLTDILHHQLTYQPTKDKNHIEEHLTKNITSVIEQTNVIGLYELVKQGKMEIVSPHFTEIEAFRSKTPEQFFLEHKEELIENDNYNYYNHSYHPNGCGYTIIWVENEDVAVYIHGEMQREMMMNFATNYNSNHNSGNNVTSSNNKKKKRGDLVRKLKSTFSSRQSIYEREANLHKDMDFWCRGFFAVTHGKQVHVWSSPGFNREFAPFVLHRKYTGHYDDVTSITWSPDGQYFLTTSKDMTAKIFSLDHIGGFIPITLSGHRDTVIAQEDNLTKKKKKKRWLNIIERYYFNQDGAKVVCSFYHLESKLLVVGFSSGIFGIWEMPEFNNIHTLSISQKKINSVTINSTGEWLAFGSSKLGQLLVWEWQSESYVLKQQGHFYDMNSIAYSSDGQYIATGGDDSKVKVWNTTTGFCFVTFSEHSSGISVVEFAKQGQVLFSASLDGTVRAFDLIRYRNFRTFTSPTPVQFTALAVDPSGEIVCAGSMNTFEIFVWSVQTGKLLDILSGHEGSISSLAFSPTGILLASGSWDCTVRTWDVFGRGSHVEVFRHSHDVLAIAFRPDGKELAVTTLDGLISFWDVEHGTQTHEIEGRKDISGGRKETDRQTAANSSSGKSFNSVCYTADGSGIIAGGNSKHVCIYDVKTSILLKKFEISRNLSLDGVREFLNSKRMTEAGPIGLFDDTGDLSDLEDRMDNSLPGTQKGDLSVRKTNPVIRTKSVKFSPTGRSWAAASTEGLIIYSLDETLLFDPFELEIDITPVSVLEMSHQKEYLKGLVMAFRLNETYIINQVYEAVPPSEIGLIVKELPDRYIERLLKFIVIQMEQQSPHIEFHMLWIMRLFMAHAKWIRQESRGQLAAVLRGLQKVVAQAKEDLGKVCDDNTYMLKYLISECKKQEHMVEHQEIKEMLTDQ